MLRMALWNVARALHGQKRNTLYENLPQGHVNVVLS
jgi:hypothetical protein